MTHNLDFSREISVANGSLPARLLVYLLTNSTAARGPLLYICLSSVS